MATGAEAKEWTEVVDRLRAMPEAERFGHADAGRLYMLAQRLAPGLLRGFTLRTETPEDLASGLLSEKFAQLVEDSGDHAWPYFVAALRNRAISWIRRPLSKVTSKEIEGVRSTEDETRYHARQHLMIVWTKLSQKEQEIFAADDAGESRESIAARFKTSRANIDQIISRARERLRALGLG